MEYYSWKKKYIRDYKDCKYVRYSEYTSNVCVSEAQGYGMLLAVYCDDYKTFDLLCDFYLLNLNENGLMKWRQNLDSSGELTNKLENSSNATDGDLDIVYALFLASEKWGTHKFRTAAINGLHAIEEWNIREFVPILGDWVHSDFLYITRPSDFLLTHFLKFKEYSDFDWGRVLETTKKILVTFTNRYKSGLISDFLVKINGDWTVPKDKVLESINDVNYYYNSCRVPWRLAEYFRQTGDLDIKRILEKMCKFFGNVNSINVGYTLTGDPLVANYYDLAFTAPVKYACKVLQKKCNLQLRFDNYYGDTIYMLTCSSKLYKQNTDMDYNGLLELKSMYTNESSGILSRDFLLLHAGQTIKKPAESKMTFGDVAVGETIKFTKSNKSNSAHLLTPLNYSIIEFECNDDIECYLWNPFQENDHLPITVLKGTKYTLDWHKLKIRLFIDGLLSFVIDNKDYHSQMFLVFTNKGVDASVTRLEIDAYKNDV